MFKTNILVINDDKIDFNIHTLATHNKIVESLNIAALTIIKENVKVHKKKKK
jgi:hypothetical protein